MTPIRFFLAALATVAAFVTPAHAAQISAVTAVNVVKPVSLSKLQDLDFGTLTYASFTGTRTIVLSRAGVITCGADIVCSGVAKQARFNVQGTNKLTVLLSYTGGALSNGTDSIPFVPNGPASVVLTSSGVPGIDFDVGGTITVAPTLIGGAYSGTLTVTADYQ